MHCQVHNKPISNHTTFKYIYLVTLQCPVHGAGGSPRSTGAGTEGEDVH